MSTVRTARPYADPNLAGVALGFVLLAAFVWVGRGLGASGAFASTAAGVVAQIAPAHAEHSPLFSQHLAAPGPWWEWLSFELIGVMIGAVCSAALAGRARWTIERASGVTSPSRLALAFGGGVLMAAGAVFARGCTSGQALTGGALLSVGSWLFLCVAFAAAYALAPLMRQVWR